MKRRLTTILAADVVGYSRLMGADEVGTLSALKALRRELVKPKEIQYRGRTVKLMGDGALMEFSSVVDAVEFAVEVQVAVAKRNAELPEERRIVYRMGINIGDIIVEGDDIHGDGVNVAARLEGLCDPGGICIARSVFNQVKGKLDLTFEYLGEKKVKNIAEPVTVYRIMLDEKAAELTTPITVPIPKKPRGRWPYIAAVIVLGAFGITGLVWWQPWAPDAEPPSIARMAFSLPEKPSIAVLPFDNLSRDPEQEYFADGLTEDIIANLSKIPNLFVIARNSMFTYKGKPVKVQQVAEEMGVRYVLEGSVRKADDRVRVTAQLIDAITGNHVWAERYDREAKNIFALQDEITLNIAAALQVELTEGDQENVRLGRGTTSLEAWSYATRALKFFRQFTKEEMARARSLIERAVELDPQYAAAWSFLGWTHWHDARWGWSASRAQSLQKAAELGQKALALDGSLPLTYQLLGSISLMNREYDDAIAHHEKAVALDPNGADAMAILGFTLTYAGRPGEATNLLQKAMRLSPYYPSWYLSTLGRAYRLTGRYDEAIVALKGAIERNPNFLHPHVVLAAAYSDAGKVEDARAEAKEILRIDPKFSIHDFAKALPYKDPIILEHLNVALRKTGLPE